MLVATAHGDIQKFILEELRALRSQGNDTIAQIAHLEERVVTLFKRAEDVPAMKTDLTTHGSRLDVLEREKRSTGDRVWQVVVLVLAAVLGGLSGFFSGRKP